MVFERGFLRSIDSVLVVLVCSAWAVLFGALGVFFGVVVVLLRQLYRPPQRGVWYLREEEVRRSLWVDRQRVVLQQPYRVIYRDEVPAAAFCRLRRLSLGLPD